MASRTAETQGLTRNQIIGQLTRSPHGKLVEYLPIGRRAAQEEPEFLAHLIAWNQEKGQVRDSKVALPVIQLSIEASYNPVLRAYRENALAHLCLLPPRDLVRALDFRKEHWLKGGSLLRKLVERYLRAREQNWSWWEKQAVQHRASMKTLYARHGIKPSAMADLVLFKGKAPAGTVFDRIKRLSELPALEIAQIIIKDRLPFLVLVGALGKRIKDEDVALALIERMTATEVVTNTKLLEKLGVKERPALRAAYAEALKRVAESKKAPALKTTRAVEQQEEGSDLQAKLRVVQEKQVSAMQVEGNWLVLGDKSPSMQGAVVVARMVAGTLASMVKGQVTLVFFDGQPRAFDVSGLGYEELCKLTAGVNAGGQGTSIGCGLQWALEKGAEVDGIAVVSDAQENTPPFFASVYRKACEQWGKEPPVYLFRFAPGMAGYQDQDLAKTMRLMGCEMQEFDLRGQTVDYYSLPNVVQTMRTARYGLADEILATPLRTVDEVLKGRVR